MAVQERTIETPTSTDTKLDMTDERSLKDLNKAFDDSFGPREGGETAAPPEPKEPKPKPRQDAPGSREKATPGHHAPVEVKRAPAAPQEADEPLNLLGEPAYRPKPRERKSIDFDEEIPSKT